MDRMPDTAQPDHAQVQDHLSARNRPRHARAFEPLRKHDLARGFDVSTIIRSSRQFFSLLGAMIHNLRNRLNRCRTGESRLLGCLTLKPELVGHLT
jgi:hypothetical protein